MVVGKLEVILENEKRTIKKIDRARKKPSQKVKTFLVSLCQAAGIVFEEFHNSLFLLHSSYFHTYRFPTLYTAIFNNTLEYAFPCYDSQEEQDMSLMLYSHVIQRKVKEP